MQNQLHQPQSLDQLFMPRLTTPVMKRESSGYTASTSCSVSEAAQRRGRCIPISLQDLKIRNCTADTKMTRFLGCLWYIASCMGDAYVCRVAVAVESTLPELSFQSIEVSAVPNKAPLLIV